MHSLDYSFSNICNCIYISFFIVPDDPEVEMEEETQALLTSDFEIGHYIRERIVPRAVLYYTGRNHTGMAMDFHWLISYIEFGLLNLHHVYQTVLV